MHGYIYIYMYICKYMYIYIYVYIYAYAHMYIYISTTRTCAPVQRCSRFLVMEAIANLSWVLREHRAGCRFRCRFRPPSCPFVEPAVLLLARNQTCSLKKSDQIHARSWRGRRCSVAQASSDHHMIHRGGRKYEVHNILLSFICFKGGPEPSNFEDLCLVNVKVKYFSKLCFGTIKMIQPEMKYLKPILEGFTSWFQRAKAWEHEFGRVPSISFMFTGSKMARICKDRYYQYLTRIWTN